MLRQLKQVKLTFWCMFLFHVQKKKNEWNCAIDQAKNLLQIFKKKNSDGTQLESIKKSGTKALWLNLFHKGFFFFQHEKIFFSKTYRLLRNGRKDKEDNQKACAEWRELVKWHKMEWKYFLLMLVKQLRKWRQLLSN